MDVLVVVVQACIFFVVTLISCSQQQHPLPVTPPRFLEVTFCMGVKIRKRWGDWGLILYIVDSAPTAVSQALILKLHSRFHCDHTHHGLVRCLSK